VKTVPLNMKYMKDAGSCL